MAIGFGACPEVGAPAPKVVEVKGDNALRRKAEVLDEDMGRCLVEASIGQDANHRFDLKLPAIDPEPIDEIGMHRQFREALPVKAGRDQATEIRLGRACAIAVARSRQRTIHRDRGDPPAISVSCGQLFVKAENVLTECRNSNRRRKAVLDMLQTVGVG